MSERDSEDFPTPEVDPPTLPLEREAFVDLVTITTFASPDDDAVEQYRRGDLIVAHDAAFREQVAVLEAGLRDPSDREGRCRACGRATGEALRRSEAHAQDCLVLELRALLGGTEPADLAVGLNDPQGEPWTLPPNTAGTTGEPAAAPEPDWREAVMLALDWLTGWTMPVDDATAKQNAIVALNSVLAANERRNEREPAAAPERVGVGARSEPAEDLRRASAPACPRCESTDRAVRWLVADHVFADDGTLCTDPWHGEGEVW